MKNGKVSVIVSVYNEESSLRLFYDELCLQLNNSDFDKEIIFVNDGSVDDSRNILEDFAKHDSLVKVINFSRNFGHEAAMMAGLDHSTGDLAVCLDADLQHPPACIKSMYEKWKEGYDIVSMYRKARKDGGWVRTSITNLFYFFMNKVAKAKLERNNSDFFMVSRRVVDVLKNDYRERNRFLRGFLQMIGFRKTQLEFIAPKRVAGESKYSFRSLITLSFTAITALSKTPLKLGLWCAALFAILGFLGIVYAIICACNKVQMIDNTFLLIFLTCAFSINFVVLGFIGEYMATIVDETKKRPPYIIMDVFENKI